jgi:hypothetical protein
MHTHSNKVLVGLAARLILVSIVVSLALHHLDQPLADNQNAINHGRSLSFHCLSVKNSLNSSMFPKPFKTVCGIAKIGQSFSSTVFPHGMSGVSSINRSELVTANLSRSLETGVMDTVVLHHHLTTSLHLNPQHWARKDT